MAFTKPSTINSLWATSGTRVVPPSSKRSLGWIAEKPPYQYFNDILYKLGQANAYLNSRGVAEWDDETEYVGEKSYIVGSNGSLYKCLVTNTDQNPVLDDGTYWKIIANGQGSEAWNILFPYEAGALVLHDSELWLAIADSTGSEPSGVNTDWDKLVRSSDSATTSVKGLVELATQTEVDIGTDASRAVTAATLANSELAGRMVDLDKAIANQFAGEVKQVAMTTVPINTLKCDGSTVSRTTYSRLFEAIGTTFGEGNGSTTFNLPDLRGEFIRGWDDGRGVDAGRTIGSYQTGSVQSHTHDLFLGQVGSEDEESAVKNVLGNIAMVDDGTETRPRSIALMYVITI